MRDLRQGSAIGMDGTPIVEARRAVTLPVLEGPRIAGVPADPRGFVPVDPHGAVIGLPDVWAVGDATTFPLKQGGLAAQQADAAATAIAARAGASVELPTAHPVHAREAVHRRPAGTSRRDDERGRREGRDDLPRPDADAARDEGAGVNSPVPTQVVIAGAGVAGLETLLALHALAGPRVTTTVLAPDATFAVRAMAVGTAFGHGSPPHARRPGDRRRHGAHLVHGTLAAVDRDELCAITDSGERLMYDALVVAVGARPEARRSRRRRPSPARPTPA